MNKRGISPIVATLLLISFAVALGVVIMNFGRAQVELEAQCPIDIGLNFAVIGGEEQICYDTGKQEISFTIENGININVEGLIVNIIGTQKAETFEVQKAKMGKAGTHLDSVSYDTSVSGEIRQVKISPKVIFYDAEQICVEQALVSEKVGTC